MKICGLQKNTLIDYPGRLAATVFLCGCNLRCPWCYSRELVLPEEIAEQPEILDREFFDFLEERKEFLEGVVICGGEPCINEDLPQFCQKIKKIGYFVKLDTNGSKPEMLKKLTDGKMIDYVAMDIKLPRERYQEVLGVDVEKIDESIKILKGSKIDHEFRTTVVPTVHTKEDIIMIAKWLSPAKKYYLQSFLPEKTIDHGFEDIKPYPDEYLLGIQKAVASFFEVCRVR